MHILEYWILESSVESLFPPGKVKKIWKFVLKMRHFWLQRSPLPWDSRLKFGTVNHIPLSPWVCTAQVPNPSGISCGEFCNGKNSLLPPIWMQTGSTLNSVQNSRNGWCWDGKEQEEKGNAAVMPWNAQIDPWHSGTGISLATRD